MANQKVLAHKTGVKPQVTIDAHGYTHGPMPTESTLTLNHHLAIEAHNGGLFVSRGRGSHPTRTIDSHELIVVRSGRLAMFEDDREITLGRGDCLILWPGRRHGGAAPYSPDLSFFWVHFNVLNAPSDTGTGRRRPKRTPLNGSSVEMPPRHWIARMNQTVQLGEASQTVFELLVRFLDDQQRPDPGGSFKRSLLLSLILAELDEAQRRPVSPVDNDDASSLANRARELIASAGLEPGMRSAGVARRLECNAEYLARVFRATFGHTLTREIHMVRIKKARELLAESRLGVKQIAKVCGFEDEAFFREVFRRHTGATPAGFRRVRSAIHVNTM